MRKLLYLVIIFCILIISESVSAQSIGVVLRLEGGPGVAEGTDHSFYKSYPESWRWTNKAKCQNLGVGFGLSLFEFTANNQYYAHIWHFTEDHPNGYSTYCDSDGTGMIPGDTYYWLALGVKNIGQQWFYVRLSSLIRKL